jgi:type I restriction enzyme S subunit
MASETTLSGKYASYPEYNDSGVMWLGDVPVHWEISYLRWYINIASGEGLSNTAFDKSKDEVNCFRVIGGNGTLGYSPHLNTTTKAIAIGRVGALCGNVHFINEDCWITDNALKLSSWRKFHDRYLTYLLKAAKLNDYASTTAQPLITGEQVKSLKVVIPLIEEQKRIASFIDHEVAKIDTLIEKQQQLIKLLKEKRQAVISHAVTKGINPNANMRDSGVEWLGEVPEHWEIRSVSKLSQKITNGYVGPTRDILVSEGVPYVQATHIKKGKVNFDDAYFVRQPWSDAHAKSILVKGDVLLVQTGAGTGDVGLVTENEAGFNCHALIIVQPIKSVISGEFLSMAFQSQYGYSVLYSIRTGGMHPHLNCGEVQFVKIPIPPKEEQSEIIKHISKQLHRFDTLIATQLLAIGLMQERRTTLISAAVTGKIDVQSWQAPKSSVQGAINGG